MGMLLSHLVSCLRCPHPLYPGQVPSPGGGVLPTFSVNPLQSALRDTHSYHFISFVNLVCLARLAITNVIAERIHGKQDVALV